MKWCVVDLCLLFPAAFFGRLDSLFNTIHVNDNNFTLQRVETIAEAQLLPGEEVIQIDRIPEGDNPYCEGCGRLVLENEPGYEAVANVNLINLYA